jgi:hypothetical protein
MGNLNYWWNDKNNGKRQTSVVEYAFDSQSTNLDLL